MRHGVEGDEWKGFGSVRIIPDSATEIVLVPLHGHTAGHTGVAIREGDRWLLHCGDAYFHHGEVATPPFCPRGLAAFAAFDEVDAAARRGNVERLRELAERHSNDVTLICSHDACYLEEPVDPAYAAACLEKFHAFTHEVDRDRRMRFEDYAPGYSSGSNYVTRSASAP